MFLTSYFAGTTDLFKIFAKEYILSKNVVFIPTAGKVEEYNEYIDEAEDSFKEMGFCLDVLDVTEVDEENAAGRISNAEILYISGGNTFFLLQELVRKNLINLIRSRVEKGLIYIGESAGAIIASPSIEYSQIMDDKEVAKDLKSYNSLDLVDVYVLPHYEEYPFEEAAEQTLKMYGKELNLITVNNSEAVVVDGEDYEITSNSGV